MSWTRTIVTAPEGEPLTLPDAREHLRVDAGDDGELIEACISAARAHIEGVTGQVLRSQTLRLLATSWADLQALPLAPVTEVLSIVYTNPLGDEVTLGASKYEVRLEGLTPMIFPPYGVAWPSALTGTLIKVTVKAGYEDSIPPELSAALKLLVGDLYTNRETTGVVTGRVSMSAAVEHLLVNQRRWL